VNARIIAYAATDQLVITVSAVNDPLLRSRQIVPSRAALRRTRHPVIGPAECHRRQRALLLDDRRAGIDL